MLSDGRPFPTPLLITSLRDTGCGRSAADLHESWLLAAHVATALYQAWSDAPRAHKAGAYAAYRAAVDDEERAAALLEVNAA